MEIRVRRYKLGVTLTVAHPSDHREMASWLYSVAAAMERLSKHETWNICVYPLLVLEIETMTEADSFRAADLLTEVAGKTWAPAHDAAPQHLALLREESQE